MNNFLLGLLLVLVATPVITATIAEQRKKAQFIKVFGISPEAYAPAVRNKVLGKLAALAADMCEAEAELASVIMVEGVNIELSRSYNQAKQVFTEARSLAWNFGFEPAYESLADLAKQDRRAFSLKIPRAGSIQTKIG